MVSQTISKEEPSTVTISARLSSEVYAKLSEMARKEQRTLSNMINVVLGRLLN